MNETIVIGLGNTLMGDEGVGVRVVHALQRDAERFAGVEFVDLGSAAMRVLHAVAGRRKAVVVDCAFLGEPAGTIRRFTPEQARSRKALTGISMHEGDLLRVLELSRQLGECPADVVIFGIEPDRVAPGEQLSDVLRQRLPEYVRAVAEELPAAESA